MAVVRRVLMAVLGILTIVAGLYCIMRPGLTYISLAWTIGAVMVVNGVANVVAWPERKKVGLANGWSLAGAVVSLVFGVVLMGSNLAKFLVDVYVLYMAAAWLVIYGVLRIAMAFKMRAARKKLLAAAADSALVPSGAQAPKARWGWVLCMGVLMVVCGVLGFLNPLTFALTLGLMVGAAILMFGFDLVTMAFVA